MTPAFDPDVTSYTATTENATNKLTAVPDDGAEVAVELNDVAVTAGSDGKFTMTWAEGENKVEITVTAGTESATYTITVNPETTEGSGT